MRLLLFLLALPAFGQFRSIEMKFEGIGCASCIESLPVRMQRIRGVEAATVDATAGVLKVTLAEQNRVRIEQIRDSIEQDGTKARDARVSVRGELSKEGDRWMLKPAGVASSYAVEGANAAAGNCTIDGAVTELRPSSGPLVIRATAVRKAE